MERSLHNKIALLIIGLIAVAPFVGFITLKTIDRHFNVIISILSVMSLYFIFIMRGELKLPTYVKLWALFTFYTIISDIYIAKFTFKAIDILFYNRYLTCLYLVILIENLKIPDDFFEKIKTITKVILVIAFLVIIIQQFYSPKFFVNVKDGEEIVENSIETRLPSIYSWIGPSAYMGLAYFPLLAIIINELIKGKSKNVWIFYFMGAIVAFLNKSRFMMLNYLIILVLIPIYEKISIAKVFRWILFISLLSIGSYFGAKAVNYDIDKVINERILEKNRKSLERSSAGTRIIAFQVFAQLFPKNPVFGKGMLHSFSKNGSKDIELVRAINGRSSQIHVGYLSLFYYYGLVGGCIFLFFLFHLLRKLYKDARVIGYWGVFLAWVMFFLTNWTGVTLSFINMGLLLSLFVNKFYLDRTIKIQTSGR